VFAESVTCVESLPLLFPSVVVSSVVMVLVGVVVSVVLVDWLVLVVEVSVVLVSVVSVVLVSVVEEELTDIKQHIRHSVSHCYVLPRMFTVAVCGP